jgi:hypothetical protein
VVALLKTAIVACIAFIVMLLVFGGLKYFTFVEVITTPVENPKFSVLVGEPFSTEILTFKRYLYSEMYVYAFVAIIALLFALMAVAVIVRRKFK